MFSKGRTQRQDDGLREVVPNFGDHGMFFEYKHEMLQDHSQDGLDNLQEVFSCLRNSGIWSDEDVALGVEPVSGGGMDEVIFNSGHPTYGNPHWSTHAKKANFQDVMGKPPVQAMHSGKTENSLGTNHKQNMYVQGPDSRMRENEGWKDQHFQSSRSLLDGDDRPKKEKKPRIPVTPQVLSSSTHQPRESRKMSALNRGDTSLQGTARRLCFDEYVVAGDQPAQNVFGLSSTSNGTPSPGLHSVSA